MQISRGQYDRYTRSKAWGKLKRQVKRRSKGICERCKTNIAGHVHHITYVNFGHESLDDLQHLCLQCHQEEHPNRNFMRAKSQPWGGTRRIPPAVKVFKNPCMAVVNGRVVYVEKP